MKTIKIFITHPPTQDKKMHSYQLGFHMRRVIDYINFNIDLSSDIIEKTIELLRSYPIEWRREIYEGLVHAFAHDQQWYEVIAEIFVNPKLESKVLAE